MSAFYHLGAVISLFMAILVLIKKDRMLSDIILGCWLICAGLNLFIYHRIVDHEEVYSLLIAVNSMIITLNGPLFYLYVDTLTKRQKSLNLKNLIHLIPFLIYLVYLIILVIQGNNVMINKLTENFFTQEYWQWKLVVIYSVVSVPAYLAASFYDLRQYNKNILERFSSLEEIELTWLRRCLTGLGITWLLFFSLEMIIQLTRLIPKGESLKYTYYLYSMVLFYLGIFGIRKTGLFSGNDIISIDEAKAGDDINPPAGETADRLNRSKLGEDKINEYMEVISAVMLNEKPFLKARLTLKDLAEQAGIPSTILSLIINERMNKNFYEFVNDYRVEEFIARFKEADKDKFTLLAIAMDCGFSSKSSFYSIFRKHTGSSPLEYFGQNLHS